MLEETLLMESMCLSPSYVSEVILVLLSCDAQGETARKYNGKASHVLLFFPPLVCF